MLPTWTKPSFEEFEANGECTAYAGGRRAERQTVGATGGPAPTLDSPAAAREPAPVLVRRSGRLPGC